MGACLIPTCRVLSERMLGGSYATYCHCMKIGTQEMQDVGHARCEYCIFLQHGNGVMKYLIAWLVIAAYHGSGLIASRSAFNATRRCKT